MNKTQKSIRIISFGFFALLLVISIIGVPNISQEIPINFNFNGADWYGSKYFIFLYPIVSFVVAITGSLSMVPQKKKNVGEMANLLYVIIANLVVGGLEIYTIISNWYV